jgi:Fe2+ transport system protein FeoA
MTLDQARRGQMLEIKGIRDHGMRIQALRFGLTVGSIVQCFEVLPAGPIIIRRNRQEIALGRGLARLIEVLPAVADEV